MASSCKGFRIQLLINDVFFSASSDLILMVAITMPLYMDASVVGTPLKPFGETLDTIYSRASHAMEGFNSLDLYHKSEILKQQANYLLTLETDEVSVKLYAWDRFFIEQYFDQESRVVKVLYCWKWRDDQISEED